MISAPLTPAESIAILERRYPEGLICRTCGVRCHATGEFPPTH
jgi:hypothetical protein